MAEFSVVSQVIETVDSVRGPVSEELRTLLVKRPISSVRRKEERASWTRFGAAKGKSGPERGITETLKEDLFIEPADPLSTVEEDDVIAQRLVSAVGRMQISGAGISRHNSASRDSSAEPTPSHSRRNSGGMLPMPPTVLSDGARTLEIVLPANPSPVQLG